MNNVKEEIDKLFNEVEESDAYKNYLSCKEQLENDKEINNVIKEIKRLQKIAVNNNDNNIEKKLKELFNELNSYPIYQSYLIYKDELNNMLSEISTAFNDYFKDMLKIN